MTQRPFLQAMLRAAVPGLPFLWLATFFLLPFLIVLKISLSDPAIAQPPYAPVLRWSELTTFLAQLDAENYRALANDDVYGSAALSSLRIAGVSTLLLLFAGFPVAYAMTRVSARWRWLLV